MAGTSLQVLIQTYGYGIVFAGTFLEGETILILAGFAAHQGYLELPLVILTAFIGSFLGDQLYFYLGRRYGNRILDRRPEWRSRAAKAKQLLDRFNTPFILVNRFLYGLRVAGPIAIGMSSVPGIRFVLLNMISAAVWALMIAGAGYLFGQAVEFFLADIRHMEEILFASLAGAGVLLWLWYRWRHRRG